jgi:glutamine synthetase
VLAGMHHGIDNRIDPGPPAEGNAYAQAMTERIPTNWFAALERFRASALMRDYFSDEFVDVFAIVKETEADRFFAEPTERDFEWYLRTI